MSSQEREKELGQKSLMNIESGEEEGYNDNMNLENDGIEDPE